MTNLVPMEWKGQRIMTTKTLAECYGTEENNIRNNYNNNKGRFIEGKHLYKLSGAELKEFTNYLQINNIDAQISSKARSLILWTERGVARHAKLLDTDMAWNVYEQLEDTYFKVQEMKQEVKQMSDNELIATALLLVNEKYEQAKEKLAQTKAELTEKTEFIDDINDCFTFTQVSQFNRQLLKDRKDIILSTATLNKVAAELCIPINKIDNPIVYSPYKRVNAYPRKVWMSAYPDIKLPEKESK